MVRTQQTTPSSTPFNKDTQMATYTPILPLQTSGPSRETPSTHPSERPPANVLPLVPAHPDIPGFRLVDASELILAAQQRLAMRLNRSSLCQLRTAGMPFVRFSERRIRYDLAACLEWLILRSFREGQNARVDPIQLLTYFGLCPSPNGAA